MQGLFGKVIMQVGKYYLCYRQGGKFKYTVYNSTTGRRIFWASKLQEAYVYMLALV